MKTETIRDLLARKGDQRDGVRLSLTLVSFGPNENYLRLVKQSDGRIDLVDVGCDDTGTDIGDEDIPWLNSEIKNWLNCVGENEEDASEVRYQEAC